MRKKIVYFILFLSVCLLVLYFIRVSPVKKLEQDIIAEIQSYLSVGTILFFQIISNTISFVSLGLPILFITYTFINKKNSKTIIVNSLIILISLGISGLLGATMKRIIKEPRPYEVDNRIVQLSVGGSNSFPSGHSLEATIIAVGGSILLFPNPITVIIVSLWAILVMFSRIILGVHNFTDILAGITLGILGFSIVRELFNNNSMLFKKKQK